MYEREEAFVKHWTLISSRWHYQTQKSCLHYISFPENETMFFSCLFFRSSFPAWQYNWNFLRTPHSFFFFFNLFRSRDRLFAGFLLHNIGTSADVEIDVCVATGDGGRSCDHPAGKFSLLGGDTEMPFAFDRLYKWVGMGTSTSIMVPVLMMVIVTGWWWRWW